MNQVVEVDSEAEMDAKTTPSKPPRRIVIIGAGPCGLGAAWRLNELKEQRLLNVGERVEWLLVDAAATAGGLASSVVDPAGFTWDLGGHVMFSHYEYFTRVLDQVVPTWLTHERESWAWMRERFIPYPVQNNIWRLPTAELKDCLDGLIQLQEEKAKRTAKPSNFGEWLQASFGPGLCKSFMVPYNVKVWAYPPSEMNVEWMGERVANVDLRQIMSSTRTWQILVHEIGVTCWTCFCQWCAVEQRDLKSWGPNATFRFPLHGGTGCLLYTSDAADE